MGLNLGDIFPNETVKTTEGIFKLHDYIGNKWLVFFSHPADYTPVCTTELATVSKLVENGEFEKRGVKVIALSCDSIISHEGWIKDINAFQGCDGKNNLPYPIISDENRSLAIMLGMLDEVDKDKSGIPLTARAVFIVGPDKKLKLSVLYPATTGRNFNEIIRVIDSLQLTSKYSVATPANWRNGEDVMISPTVSDSDASVKFTKGYRTVDVPSGKRYIRLTGQPHL